MTCCVCFEQYNDSDHLPLLLSCSHTLCKGCIHSLGTSFECPTCRAPQSGRNFTTNYGILDMLAQLPQQKAAPLPPPARRSPFGVDIAPPLLQRKMSMEELQRLHGIRTFGTETPVEVEEPPIACELREDVPRCFVTSFKEAGIIVEVDLVKKGFLVFTPSILAYTTQVHSLDNVDLIAMISLLVARRRDCPSKFEMRASLLCDGQTPENSPHTKSLSHEFPRGEGEDGKWTRVGLLFDNVPKFVRKIVVQLSGQDSKYWAGNYGSKFANLEIRVERVS